jgi:hypothetical protein
MLPFTDKRIPGSSSFVPASAGYAEHLSNQGRSLSRGVHLEPQATCAEAKGEKEECAATLLSGGELGERASELGGHMEPPTTTLDHFRVGSGQQLPPLPDAARLIVTADDAHLKVLRHAY